MASELLAQSGTVLFDFPYPSTAVTRDATAVLDSVENFATTVLKSEFGPLERVLNQEMIAKNGSKNYVRMFIEPKKGVTLTLRTYHDDSLITGTLEYDKKYVSAAATTYENIKGLEKIITQLLLTEKKTKSIPELKRGLKHDIYFLSSDERLLEYDVKEMVFDKQSKFQHVQIARTETYGNALILDDYVNLAESDLIYTESLMWRGKFDYTGKSVLILGGGDGALLHELLKEDISQVTMIDIDDAVMEGCRKHLRSACGNALDSYKQERYEIIVGDCVAFMKKCMTDGRKFDVIFGDLTDIPISSKPQGTLWEFILEIIRLSFSILRKGGVYMTHANGISAAASLKMFETAVLGHLVKPVSFTRLENFVPSFMEKWVFYQIKEIE